MLASIGTPIIRAIAGLEYPVTTSTIAPERSRIAHRTPTGSQTRSNAVRNALAPSPNSRWSRGSTGSSHDKPTLESDALDLGRGIRHDRPHMFTDDVDRPVPPR